MTGGATIALTAAFLLFLLLQRLHRDAGRRTDTRYFYASGVLSALRLTATALIMLAGLHPHKLESLSVVIFESALLSNALLVWFSYSFPVNRRVPHWLLVAVGIPTVFVGLTPLVRADMSRWAPAVNALYFVPLIAMAVYFQHRNRRQVIAEAGRSAAVPVAIVQAAIVVPWLASIVLMSVVTRRYGWPPPSKVVLVQAVASTLVITIGIAIAIMRYHLLEVRVMAYELVLAVLASVGMATYVSYGAPSLYRALEGAAGVEFAAPVLSVVPPIVLGAAWLTLSQHLHRMANLMARREAPRSAVERVLEVTKRVVDPQAVLSMVLGETISATGGDARYVRVGSVPSEEYAVAPPALSAFAANDPRPFLARTQAAELDPAVTAAMATLDASLVIPVRRGTTTYGFLVVSGCDLARNVAEIGVALADQLAIKFENVALFAEAAAHRRELDETRERLGRQLEESRRLAALGQFAAAIAHDIRTPLTSIQMNVQIVRGKPGLCDNDREYLDIAVEEIARLTQSVGEILDYAKPLALADEWHDVRDVIDDARRTVEPRVHSREIAVSVTLPSGAARIRVDPRRLRQALVNLLENAVDASPHGARVAIVAAPMDSGGLSIDVRDDGRGITSENLAKIFEPFFTTRPDGTGLGLPIAQKIVRAHGGEIVVNSEPGRGTRFRVEIPSDRTDLRSSEPEPKSSADTAATRAASSAA